MKTAGNPVHPSCEPFFHQFIHLVSTSSIWNRISLQFRSLFYTKQTAVKSRLHAQFNVVHVLWHRPLLLHIAFWRVRQPEYSLRNSTLVSFVISMEALSVMGAIRLIKSPAVVVSVVFATYAPNQIWTYCFSGPYNH